MEEAGVRPLKEVRLRQVAKANGKELPGRIQSVSVEVAGVAGESSKEASLSWPYDVDIMAGSVYGVIEDAGKTAQIDHGDGVCAWVEAGDEKTLGTLAGAEDTTDDTITVASGQGANFTVGMWVRITSAATLKWYQITAISGDILTLDANLAEAASGGDSVNAALFGLLASGAAINDTDIVLKTGQGAFFKGGEWVKIGTPTTERWYRVDTISGDTLTLHAGLDEAVNVDDLVALRVYFVGDYDTPIKLTPGKSYYEWGEETFDASRLVANTPLKMSFHNASTAAKSAVGEIVILY